MKSISDSLDDIMSRLDKIEKLLQPITEPLIMWEHNCKVEETSMLIEKDGECNWCGRSEEHEHQEFGKLDKGWDDSRMDIIGQNGNDGTHYADKDDPSTWDDKAKEIWL